MITDKQIVTALSAAALGFDFNPPSTHRIAEHFLPAVRELIDQAEDDVREDERYNAMGDDR